MEMTLLHQPDSTVAHLTLAPYEEVIAEAGAMVAMSGQMTTSTTLRQGQSGGLMGGLKRMVTGESLFLSQFRAGASPGELFLAPRLPGDILLYDMAGLNLVIQSTGYLACTPGVQLDLGFPGMKTLFSGESLFWIVASGSGQLLLTSFGGIYEIPVDGSYVVDTSHIVAFERSLDFTITKAGDSWIGAFLGGEGFVCRFQGRGRLFCQTHNPGAFGHRVGSRLPARG
jgi:uncharacterized protein (TIGR00266 family)